MKIKYSKSQIRLKLIFSLFWIVFAGIQLVFVKSIQDWVKYLWLALAALYLGQFIHQYIYQYLTIKDGYIKRNSLFGKKLILTEIYEIRKFAKKYTLKTNTDELVIHLDLIDSVSLIKLNAELKKYKIKWT